MCMCVRASLMGCHSTGNACCRVVCGSTLRFPRMELSTARTRTCASSWQSPRSCCSWECMPALYGMSEQGKCVLQSSLRKHFEIPPPDIEHRAHEDVRVLVAITRKLLQLGVHGSLEEAVEAALKDNAQYADHYSAAVQKSAGVCCCPSWKTHALPWRASDMRAPNLGHD